MVTVCRRDCFPFVLDLPVVVAALAPWTGFGGFYQIMSMSVDLALSVT